LNNENIDLVEYSEDPRVYIMRALSPAKVQDIDLSIETKTANVTVNDDQVALAVGKNGQNVRLASKLTGFNIIITKLGDEDIELSEFKTEFGEQLFTEVTSLGIETAKEFLDGSVDDLLKLETMTKEKLIELRALMLVEFDEKESPDVIKYISSI